MPRGYKSRKMRALSWLALNRQRPFARGSGRDDPPWIDDPDWEPSGGWQEGNLDLEELEYLTHEEMIDFFDELAEEWDVDVDDIWEMYREAMGYEE